MVFDCNSLNFPQGGVAASFEDAVFAALAVGLKQTDDVRDWLVCDDSAGRCTLGCEKGKHTYICSHVHYRLVLRDLETRRCVRMVDPRFPDHEKDVCR